MSDIKAAKPLRVVELRSENVKRLRAVRIRPTGATVVIGGKNAQGKSSVLDSLEMALNGGQSIPADPIRHGTKRAVTVVDLGELVIERTYTAAGSQLVVKNREGVKQASPQGILDALLGSSRSVAFDPLEFARMKPVAQDELLKRLVGIDFGDVDRKRSALYDQRTDVNRDLKRTEATVTSMPFFADATEPVNVSQLHTELKTRTDARVAREKAIGRAAKAKSLHEVTRADVLRGRQDIARLARELEAAKEALAHLEQFFIQSANDVSAAEAAVPPEVSCDDLHAAIASAESVNAKCRANEARAKATDDVARLRDKVSGLTSAIQRCDDDKASMIAQATFPVPGLGFGEHGPTLNGVPLEQASSAEKLRLSVAIGAALNPRIKVMLVRDGSLLDDDSMRLLAELAEQTDSQVWIERLGDKDASAVVIEDGEVADGLIP